MKKFKTHSERILQLMINSIYTNKEIALRELISNASDAIDKAKFNSLIDPSIEGEFYIEIKVDKEKRTITVIDTGIGMTEKEAEENLGTIAESGTEKFRIENKTATDEQLIGKFGVGFYSAFMIADKVEVLTKTQNGVCVKWESDATGYTLSEGIKHTRGTEITLFIKPSKDEENYEDYLASYHIQTLIRRYSDYIRYPIYMTHEGGERSPVNSMVPIWKKSLKDNRGEIESYFQSQYYQPEPPLEIISASMEGTVSYNTLLFIPSLPSFDYGSPEYERGLSLYSNGVLIMETCKNLLPEYLGFVRGMVDSSDLNLNISREMLQQDRQLTLIARSIEKKVLNTLTDMLKNSREKYEKFFNAFGFSIKLGVYSDFGAKKDDLKDLLMFYSSKQKKLVTLKEYTETCDGNIYYAAGLNIEQIEHLPVIDTFKNKDLEVLYFSDRLDEFVTKILDKYDNKPFKSVMDKDVKLEESSEAAVDYKELLDKIKSNLKGRVIDVVLSGKLTSQPVLLTSQNNISLEMERTLDSVNRDNKAKAERILELNPNHPVLLRLKRMDADDLHDASIILYNQALLLGGLPTDNAAEFCDSLNKLLS